MTALSRTLALVPLVEAPSLRSAASRSTLGARLLQFPLTRLVLVLLCLAPVAALNFALSVGVWDRLPKVLAAHQIVFQALWIVAGLILAYGFYCRKVEGRSAVELSRTGALREFLVGAGISAAWVLTYVGLLAATGGYRVAAVHSLGTLLDGAALFGMGAFAQELAFGLIVFRLLEDGLGSRAAFVLAIGVFVAAHAFNPHQTLTSNLGLAVGGASFLAGFLLTRRIWFSWGMHFAWNLLQAGVFGMPNSGMTFKGLLKPVITGPTWLTGGAFGFEASWLTLAFSALLTLVLVRQAIRNGQLVSPSGRR